MCGALDTLLAVSENGTVSVCSEFGECWALSYSVFNKTAVQRCLVACL
jgi:hypothetical protein